MPFNIKFFLSSILKRKNTWLKIVLFLFIYWVLYQNTFHESYPDEFDNILGGKYIVHGIMPYSGFFSHHGPVAYFVGALVYLFSGSSFVHFRIFYSIFLLLFFLLTYIFLKKSVGVKETNVYLIFLVLVSIASTYFWGHMLIADNLSAYFIIPVFALLTLKVLYKKALVLHDFSFMSFFIVFALLSSITFSYLVFFSYLFIFYLFFTQNSFSVIKKNLIKVVFIMIIPYVVFLCYLLITRSFSDYLYQSIIFNEKYYIYNYPGPAGGTSINPIRYAIVIFSNFYNSFYNLLFQVKDFNFVFPFNISLAVADVALSIYFLTKKHYVLFIFYFLALVYANARSSPLDSSEKDYQAAVYIVISLFSICLFLSKAYESLKNDTNYAQKLILSVLFVIVGIYSFFNVAFLFERFKDKAYPKYMGQAALIYDRPEIAPILNKIITKDDYIWIGPLEFEEYLYAQGNLASKYHILIPAMGRSEKIQSEMIADFKKNMPKVIYFSKSFSILGQSPEKYGKFFTDFLNENYITLYPSPDKNITYVSQVGRNLHLDIVTKLYINKNNKIEIINKMLSENLIKEESEK